MGKQKINPRKKAPTPEGEEGPSKKRKASEDNDAKKPEEAIQGAGEVKRPNEEGSDGKEARRQDDGGPREEGTSDGLSGEGAAGAAERRPLERGRSDPEDEVQGQGRMDVGQIYETEDESGKEEASDRDLPLEGQGAAQTDAGE